MFWGHVVKVWELFAGLVRHLHPSTHGLPEYTQTLRSRIVMLGGV
jgi:hypothetical protein